MRPPRLGTKVPDLQEIPDTNFPLLINQYFLVQEQNYKLHPKTLFEISMVLSTNSGSFPSNSHVSATFSILLRFGESCNSTNCDRFNADGSLMGRTNLDKSVW